MTNKELSFKLGSLFFSKICIIIEGVFYYKIFIKKEKNEYRRIWENYVKGIYYKGNYSLGCKYILKQRKKNTNCYFVIYRYFSNK